MQAKMKEGFMQDKFGHLGRELAEVEEEQKGDGRGRREEGGSKIEGGVRVRQVWKFGTGGGGG